MGVDGETASPRSAAIMESENPARLSSRTSPSTSSRTRLASRSMNHRSMPLLSVSDSASAPLRSASRSANRRRSLGWSIVSGPSSHATGGFCSSDLMALMSAASKVRSTAITSPVDAI